MVREEKRLGPGHIRRAASRTPEKPNGIVRIHQLNYDELFLESERPAVVVSGLTCSVCFGEDSEDCDACNGTGVDDIGR